MESEAIETVEDNVDFLQKIIEGKPPLPVEHPKSLAHIYRSLEWTLSATSKALQCDEVGMNTAVAGTCTVIGIMKRICTSGLSMPKDIFETFSARECMILSCSLQNTRKCCILAAHEDTDMELYVPMLTGWIDILNSRMHTLNAASSLPKEFNIFE